MSNSEDASQLRTVRCREVDAVSLDHPPRRRLRILAAMQGIAPENVRSLPPYEPPVPEGSIRTADRRSRTGRGGDCVTLKHTPKRTRCEIKVVVIDRLSSKYAKQNRLNLGV